MRNISFSLMLLDRHSLPILEIEERNFRHIEMNTNLPFRCTWFFRFDNATRSLSDDTKAWLVSLIRLDRKGRLTEFHRAWPRHNQDENEIRYSLDESDQLLDSPVADRRQKPTSANSVRQDGTDLLSDHEYISRQQCVEDLNRSVLSSEEMINPQTRIHFVNSLFHRSSISRRVNCNRESENSIIQHFWNENTLRGKERKKENTDWTWSTSSGYRVVYYSFSLTSD